MRVRSPRGALVEGTGVQPDFPVKWTVEDHLESNDRDLAKAIEILTERR